MATALLGLLLLPKPKSSKAATAATHDPSHLLIVTSEAHRWLVTSDFPDPKDFSGSVLQAVNAGPRDGKRWDPLIQNARSKLLAMYVSGSLAAPAMNPKNEPDTVVTSVCPGACKSDLARDLIG